MKRQIFILSLGLFLTALNSDAVPNFKALCVTYKCSEIGPARNGSCKVIKPGEQYKIEAKYTVNTNMEGNISSRDSQGGWYPPHEIKGGWGHEAIEFEPLRTWFHHYVFIPTKRDAKGYSTIDSEKYGYIMYRPANFGAAFRLLTVRCSISN